MITENNTLFTAEMKRTIYSIDEEIYKYFNLYIHIILHFIKFLYP